MTAASTPTSINDTTEENSNMTSPNRRTFTVDQLNEFDFPYESVASEYLGDSRWYDIRRAIFLDPADGTYWGIRVCSPKTEHQEIDWWYLHDRERVVAHRVEQREVTITKWVPVSTDDEAGA